MSLTRLVITAVEVEKRSKSAVAAEYGVSRRWVQKLCLRYRAEGDAAFEARSRRPRSSPLRTPVSVEDEIVTLRKELSEAGLDAGAATIGYHLTERHGTAPSLATIWRVLRRRGFVRDQPHKRPKSSIIRFQADLPNERWQADVTHWVLRNGREVEILNQIDDHSRLWVGADVRGVFGSLDVVECFAKAAGTYGCPAGYLTDNGAVFTGAYRHGWVAFEKELAARGVLLRHSRPYHPQTCGKVERLHQTMKQWLRARKRAGTLTDLQAQLDEFRGYYNEIRPHRAVGRKPPILTYMARPKALPHGPLDVTQFRVRRDMIDTGGTVTLRHGTRLHHIGVGRRFAGRSVLLLVQDLDVRIVDADGELIRALTLDPTRDYQRQAK
jgi:transposase InsO family protein